MSSSIDDNGRICTKCKVYKPWGAFNKNPYKGAPNNRQSSCRTCNRLRDNNKQRQAAEASQGITATGKVCSCCGKFGAWDKFPKLNHSKKVQYPKFCLKCKRQKAKQSAKKAKAADWYRWRAQQLRTSWLGRVRKAKGDKSELPSLDDTAEWLRNVPMVCHYSGDIVDKELMQVDHKRALARGGSYALDNLAISTKEMNALKGNLHEEEFVGLLDLMASWEDNGKALISTLRRAQCIWR